MTRARQTGPCTVALVPRQPGKYLADDYGKQGCPPALGIQHPASSSGIQEMCTSITTTHTHTLEEAPSVQGAREHTHDGVQAAAAHTWSGTGQSACTSLGGCTHDTLNSFRVRMSVWMAERRHHQIKESRQSIRGATTPGRLAQTPRGEYVHGPRPGNCTRTGLVGDCLLLLLPQLGDAVGTTPCWAPAAQPPQDSMGARSSARRRLPLPAHPPARYRPAHRAS